MCFRIRFITLLLGCGAWQFIADLIFVLSVQVKHLEVSCASMADDICKKSAIIETYVMDSRRGKRLCHCSQSTCEGLQIRSGDSCYRSDWKTVSWRVSNIWLSLCCVCADKDLTLWTEQDRSIKNKTPFRLIQWNGIIYFLYVFILFLYLHLYSLNLLLNVLFVLFVTLLFWCCCTVEKAPCWKIITAYKCLFVRVVWSQTCIIPITLLMDWK